MQCTLLQCPSETFSLTLQALVEALGLEGVAADFTEASVKTRGSLMDMVRLTLTLIHILILPLHRHCHRSPLTTHL